MQTTHATPSNEVAPEAVSVRALDGLALAGTVHRAARPRATVLLLGGTGIPRRFYDAFAAHLAGRGLTTLTLDYRGVGDSRPERWKGFDATKIDWARLDFSGGFDWLEREVPGVPRLVLGHSVGGQLLGLMSRPEAFDGVLTYGTSFGYWANMPFGYGLFVASLWYVGVPVGTALFDRMPFGRLGLGEDLPRGVARDWARWGRRSDYFVGELGDEPGFAALRAPWLALYASDDRIATPENATPLLAAYPNAAQTVRTLRPEELGLRELGHLSFFRRGNAALWPLASDWLVERADAVREESRA